MGRPQKISKDDVRDYLEENGKPVTMNALCKIFNCTPPTIRARLKALRKQGYSVLPTCKGIFYSTKINTEGEARLMEIFGRWVVAGLISFALISKVGSKPLLEALKVLNKNLNPAEKVLWRELITIVKTSQDILEVDRLLEEGKE